MIEAYTRIFDMARARLPGVLEDTMKHELFAVLDEFFQNSEIWTEDIPVSVNTTNRDYDLESNENCAAVVRLQSVANSDDIQIAAAMPTGGTLHLRDLPSAADTYTVTAVLTVGDPVRQDEVPDAPDWVLIKYRVGLVDGLLSRLMSQPAKPYSSERYAIYHARRFRNAMAQARSDARHQNLSGGQRWAYPQNFR